MVDWSAYLCAEGDMERLRFLSWRVAALLLMLPCLCQSLNVRILNEEPVHVIPGATLLLRARIEAAAWERLTLTTWERETETGSTPNRVTLATCPGRDNSTCTRAKSNVQAERGEQEATLQISGYAPSDGGDYIVTVTLQNGNKTRARCIVREYEAVHHVSVSINVSHSVLVCAEAWGTEPNYSWQHNRLELSHTVAEVSQDGTTLQVLQSPMCGRFTCRVSNKLGYATATYIAGACESREDHSGAIPAVVCVLLMLFCAGLLGLLLWWRRRRSVSGRERLHEHMER